MAEPVSAEEFLDHVMNCGPTRPDALIVCDTGVNGDDTIANMLASGEWELVEGTEYVAGKRIRNLRKVAGRG